MQVILQAQKVSAKHITGTPKGVSFHYPEETTMNPIKHITMNEYNSVLNTLRVLPSELHKQVMEHVKEPPKFLKVTLMPTGRTSTFRRDDDHGFYWHDAGCYGFTLGKLGDKRVALDLEGADREENPLDQDIITDITEAEYAEDNRGYYHVGDADAMLTPDKEDDDDVPY